MPPPPCFPSQGHVRDQLSESQGEEPGDKQIPHTDPGLEEGEGKRFHGTSRSQRSEDGSSSSGLSIKTCKNKKDVSLVPAEGR